jgi:ankyrin repeat protein
MKGRLASLIGVAVFLSVIPLQFQARAFEPQFTNATLQIGSVMLKPVEVSTPWKSVHSAGSNSFNVFEDTVERPAAEGTNPVWTARTKDGASLGWLAASTNIAYLGGCHLGPDNEFRGYELPLRLRRLDLQTGKWLADLSITNAAPVGFKNTNIVAALAVDERVFVLISFSKEDPDNRPFSTINAYTLCCFNADTLQSLWTKEFSAAGGRKYTGGFLWGVPRPAYAGSDIHQLSLMGEHLLVCPEAMQPVFCLNSDTGTELWRIERPWEYQRGFIGPSVWSHYIGRFGIEEDFDLEKTNINDARAAFDKQFQCALTGGPISVPLTFERGEDTHSLFLTVVKGQAQEWAGYLSDCVLYEFGDDGKPVSMGTLPQVVIGSQFCVRGSDVIWKCQNSTFARVSPARSNQRLGMGPGGPDLLFNLAWVRRLQYQDPQAWFVSGKGSDPVAFAANYAFCVPGGGYVLHTNDTCYSFPIAAIDLSTGMETFLTLNLPFKGPFTLPDSNMGFYPLPDGTYSCRALNWQFVTITGLETRGRRLEVTLANENTSTVLAFDIENALPAPATASGQSTENPSAIARARALAVPPDKLNETLEAAANGTDAEFVKALLAAGADPKYSTKSGWTALMNASAYGTEEMVEILINAGSDVNAVNAANENCCGQPVLMWAAGSQRDPNHKVRTLLKSGANLNATATDGANALIRSANWGHVDVSETLLQAGPSISSRDNDGETPLIAAASFGGATIVSVLLRAGSDKNATDAQGMTALMHAAQNGEIDGELETVELLLNAGADPNLRDKKGRTALQIAQEVKSKDSSLEAVIKLLKPVTKSTR